MPTTESRRKRRLAAFARRNWRFVLYPVGLLPACWLIWQGQTGRLGADPVNVFERALGLWAFRFLLACLLITPLRRLTGINLTNYRRLTGLLAFFYACLHLLAYIGLDIGFDWAVLWKDVTHRFFVILGMAALLLLLPLALTSNLFSMRKMGRKWKRLHQAVFLAAPLAGLHFFLAFKTLNGTSTFYLSVLVSALLIRVIYGLGSRKSRRV